MIRKLDGFDILRFGVWLRELRSSSVVNESGSQTEERATSDRARLKTICEMCEALEMPVSAKLFQRAMDDPPQSLREFEAMEVAMITEIESRSFIYIPHEQVKYYENADLLSDDARAAFPSASAELREAATCFAVARYTGAVLHCMRAAEVGVKAMSRALGYNPPDLEQQDWHPVLLKCESAIEELRSKMKKGPEKEAELTFYSQAATQFRHFKDGYRVQAAHARPPFLEGEAKQILDATIAFYVTLARRLSEDAQQIEPEQSS